MNITIFNVEHGFCAAVDTDERHTLLIDCGYSFRTGFRPARYLINNTTRYLNYLIVPTYTEDHLAGFSDFINHFLEGYFSIAYLVANPSIDTQNLPELIIRNFGTTKSAGLFNKVSESFWKGERSIHIGNLEVSFFWNNYPEFLDFYNLSLVTFLSYQDINIIFPGNLKVEGWCTLLRKAEFRARLKRVNLFVASNHGQEDGYCPDIFNYCDPDLVIISNQVHRQLPSSAIRQYERHARGIGTAWGQQKVLATHDVGTITIEQSPGSSLQVITQPSKVYQY
jgi:beta-lactamase superfamily II metal-dependent hydrolase